MTHKPTTTRPTTRRQAVAVFTVRFITLTLSAAGGVGHQQSYQKSFKFLIAVLVSFTYLNNALLKWACPIFDRFYHVLNRFYLYIKSVVESSNTNYGNRRIYHYSYNLSIIGSSNKKINPVSNGVCHVWLQAGFKRLFRLLGSLLKLIVAPPRHNQAALCIVAVPAFLFLKVLLFFCLLASWLISLTEFRVGIIKHERNSFFSFL